MPQAAPDNLSGAACGPAQPWRAVKRGFFLLITKVLPCLRTTWAPGLFFIDLNELRTFTPV